MLGKFPDLCLPFPKVYSELWKKGKSLSHESSPGV